MDEKSPPDEIEREVQVLYEMCGAGLLRYAAAMSRDCELARDAVQEVLLRYFVERRLGRRIGNPRAWAYRVLRNHVLDRLAAAAARCEVGAEEAESATGRNDADAGLWRSEAVREITATLSPRELECLRLRAEGLSYTEIASVMDIRIGTVGALLTRSHDKIRRTTADETARQGVLEALLYWSQGSEDYSS